MRRADVMTWILMTGAAAVSGVGQTQVDLRNQSRNIDFSAAVSTKPAKLGTTLPAACTTGDMFFKADASPGQNLYGCTSTNTWSLETAGGGGGGTGSGATSAAQLSDLRATMGSSTALNLGAACAPANPCNVRFGSGVFSILNGGTATLSGGTGTAFLYVASSGQLTVGHNLTLTCNSGCVAQSGVTSFPVDSVPLFTWTATGGSWDPSGGVDFRSFLSAKSVTSGTGLLSTDVGGVATLSVDTTVVGLRAAVPATSSAACTTGAWAADPSFFYICVAANTWKRVAISTW